jgi:antirestriction protein
MTDAPRVWCGTYAKYSEGNLEGNWFDLEDYADEDELYAAFQEFHGPGEHEFMLCDFEGFPRAYCGESRLDPALWDWLELDEDDRELLAVYKDNVYQDGDIDKARDAYMGKFDSEEAWAEDYWEQSGLLETIPENLRYYVDYKSYARDCRLGGDVSFVEHDGEVWVFSNS